MPTEISSLVFMVLVFAAAFTAVQAVLGLVQVGRVKLRMNRRLVMAERIGSLSDLVVELRKQRGLNAAGERRVGWAWFSNLVLRSGVVYRPRQWALIVPLIGLGVGAGLYTVSHMVILALAAAPIAAVGGPILYLQFRAARRAHQLGEQLPNALEIIVRSLEAGHPVPTAIALVGREMPDPIGSEFGMAADEIAFGAALDQAIGRMAERCSHADMDLLAATVRLQERAGGNLTGLLKMNARTIRERQRMRLKIKAASSEGKVSAIILTSAPFVVLGLLTVASPNFYGDVIDEPFIRKGLVGLGVWMFIGNMMIRNMINMKI